MYYSNWKLSLRSSSPFPTKHSPPLSPPPIPIPRLSHNPTVETSYLMPYTGLLTLLTNDRGYVKINPGHPHR